MGKERREERKRLRGNGGEKEEMDGWSEVRREGMVGQNVARKQCFSGRLVEKMGG